MVVSVPANSGLPRWANAIVGATLLDFVRLGLIRGYFAMEQFVLGPELAAQAYASADWQPTERDHYSMGFGVTNIQRQMMKLIADELKIEPISYTPEEFEALQNKYMPLLKF